MMIKNRALTIATRGLLGGVLARVTRGLLQSDSGGIDLSINSATHRHTSDEIRLAVPVPGPELVPARPGGGAGFITYHDLPKHYKHVSESMLVLLADSIVKQSYRTPFRKPKPKRRYTVYESIGELRLYSSSESSFWDQGKDDDDLAIVLAAMEYFR